MVARIYARGLALLIATTLAACAAPTGGPEPSTAGGKGEGEAVLLDETGETILQFVPRGFVYPQREKDPFVPEGTPLVIPWSNFSAYVWGQAITKDESIYSAARLVRNEGRLVTDFSLDFGPLAYAVDAADYSFFTDTCTSTAKRPEQPKGFAYFVALPDEGPWQLEIDYTLPGQSQEALGAAYEAFRIDVQGIPSFEACGIHRRVTRPEAVVSSTHVVCANGTDDPNCTHGGHVTASLSMTDPSLNKPVPFLLLTATLDYSKVPAMEDVKKLFESFQAHIKWRFTPLEADATNVAESTTEYDYE